MNLQSTAITNKLFIFALSTPSKVAFSYLTLNLRKVKRSVTIIGAGKVEVFVKSGSYKANDLIDLQVRMPNPRITKTIDGLAEPGKTWKGSYAPVGLEGTNQGVIEVSVTPPMNLEQRLKYLTQYPHGCVEQTTSAVFPQLFLHRFIELDEKQKNQIQNHITAGINKLKSFQVSNGGLSYWPGFSSSVSEWGTSYAGHFMLEAEALGYNLPIGFISNWAKYQARMANSWERESGNFYHRRSNEINQAYRLYTLALAKKPALGAMNRMREMKELSLTSKWTLAGAYLLIEKKEVARELVARLSTTVKPYRELSYTYGSAMRDQAIILDVVTQMGDMSTARKIVEKLAANLASGNWYGTQTTAFTLLAIAKFVGGSDSFGEINFELILDGKSRKVSSTAPIVSMDLPFVGLEGGEIELRNKKDHKLFITVQLSGIPLDNPVEDENSDMGMRVRYLNLDGKVIDPSNLEQGSDFMAEVKLTHPGVRGDYKELALTQMFPSGWEIRNLRLDNIESSRTKDTPDYQDIRDDRVYSYFSLKKNESKTFIIMLNASYLGEYLLPAVYCEAMYDNNIHATKAGKWVKVTQQK